MIRVISGRLRGRRLLVPRGTMTRPTGERARQALFDMLAHAPFAGRSAIEGARVVDAFAGTGALGIEALSRGAAEAVFIERDGAALAALRANLASLGLGPGQGGAARVVAGDATRPPPPPFAATLAFLDPPYGEGLALAALAALAARGWFADAGLACVETARAEALEVPGFTLLDDRAHGRARLRCLRFDQAANRRACSGSHATATSAPGASAAVAAAIGRFTTAETLSASVTRTRTESPR